MSKTSGLEQYFSEDEENEQGKQNNINENAIEIQIGSIIQEQDQMPLSNIRTYVQSDIQVDINNEQKCEEKENEKHMKEGELKKDENYQNKPEVQNLNETENQSNDPQQKVFDQSPKQYIELKNEKIGQINEEDDLSKQNFTHENPLKKQQHKQDLNASINKDPKKQLIITAHENAQNYQQSQQKQEKLIQSEMQILKIKEQTIKELEKQKQKFSEAKKKLTEKISEKILQIEYLEEKIRENEAIIKTQNQETAKLQNQNKELEEKKGKYKEKFKSLESKHENCELMIKLQKDQKQLLNKSLQEAQTKLKKCQQQLQKRQMLSQNLSRQIQNLDEQIYQKNQKNCDLQRQLKKSRMQYRLLQLKLQISIEDERSRYLEQFAQHQLQSQIKRQEYQINSPKQIHISQKVHYDQLIEQVQFLKTQEVQHQKQISRLTDQVIDYKNKFQELGCVIIQKQQQFFNRYSNLNISAKNTQKELNKIKQENQNSKRLLQQVNENTNLEIKRLENQIKSYEELIRKYNKNIEVGLLIQSEFLKVKQYAQEKVIQSDSSLLDILPKDKQFEKLFNVLHQRVMNLISGQNKVIQYLQKQWINCGFKSSQLNQLSLLGIFKKIIEYHEMKTKLKENKMYEIDKSYQQIYAKCMNDECFTSFGYELVDKIRDALDNKYQSLLKISEMASKISYLENKLCAKQIDDYRQIEQKMEIVRIQKNPSKREQCQQCKINAQEIRNKQQLLQKQANETKRLSEQNKYLRDQLDKLLNLKEQTSVSTDRLKLERQKKLQEANYQQMKLQTEQIRGMIEELYQNIKFVKNEVIQYDTESTQNMIRMIEREFQNLLKERERQKDKENNEGMWKVWADDSYQQKQRREQNEQRQKLEQQRMRQLAESECLFSWIEICPKAISKVEISDKLAQYFFNYNGFEDTKQLKIRLLGRQTSCLIKKNTWVLSSKTKLENIVLFVQTTQGRSFCIYANEIPKKQQTVTSPCIFFLLSKQSETYPKDLANLFRKATIKIDKANSLIFGVNQIIIKQSQQIICNPPSRQHDYFKFPNADFVTGKKKGRKECQVSKMEIYQMYWG